MEENIHPIFDNLIQREDRELKLGQKGCAIWLTGLSGSGKSTIAVGLEKRLFKEDILVKVLDGDNIRSGLCNNLGFSLQDRRENIRRISEASKLFVQAGIVTINSFVSPTRKVRSFAKSIIGEDDFIEVYINTPLHICEQRDVKGLYAKARKGEISNFTGIDSPYEAPLSPNIEVFTEGQSVDQSVDIIYEILKKKIFSKN